jgi:uncharacterized protein (TIGR02246 family)
MRRERLSILVLLLLLCCAAPCLAQSGGGPPQQQPNSIKPPQAMPTRGISDDKLKRSEPKPPSPPKGDSPRTPQKSAPVTDPAAGERQVLEALKAGDMPAFASFLADDAMELTPQGLQSKAQIIETLKGGRLLEYTMTDLKAIQVDKDAMLVTYRTTGKFSAHGQEGAYDARATSLWVKRNGKWLAVFHQETPVAAH